MLQFNLSHVCVYICGCMFACNIGHWLVTYLVIFIAVHCKYIGRSLSNTLIRFHVANFVDYH